MTIGSVPEEERAVTPRPRGRRPARSDLVSLSPRQGAAVPASSRLAVVSTSPRSYVFTAAWLVLFPLAHLLHIGEELLVGERFYVWASRLTGLAFGSLEFLVLNGTVWCCVCLVTVLILRKAKLQWLLSALASAVLLNGVAHILASLTTRSYSPGTITGMLLWVPLGLLTLLELYPALRRTEFWGGVGVGVGFHAIMMGAAFAISMSA